MSRLLRAVLAAGAVSVVATAVAGPPTGKNAGTTPVVFVAVDAVALYATNLYVRGVVDGESAPSDWFVPFSYSTDALAGCQQAALAAMAKPGAYRFELGSTNSSYGYGYCRLSRVTP